MPNAPHPAEPTPKPHQGVGARFLHRLGGAVRGVIAGGIALAASRRRPAAPQPRPTTSPPADPAKPPRPRQPRAPRRPRTAEPAVAPTRPGWIARWFGRNRHHGASFSAPQSPDSGNGRFTPEAYPHLTPAVCDFLNTPVEECDPDILHLTLTLFARHLAESLPPELGLNAEALFSTLLDRLGSEAGTAQPDAPPPEAPAPDDATHPAPVPQAERTDPADDTTAAVVATGTTPDAAFPAGPAVRGNPPPFDRGRPFRRRPLAHRCRSPDRRGLPGAPHHPPPRRLYYAACAGPP